MRPPRCRESGQAAIEFFFVMIGMLMIMGMLVTLFSFSQDVFFQTTRARSEMLKKFHDAVQFKVGGDTEYKPDNQIKVSLRQVPYLEKLVSGVGDFEREMTIKGGTAPTGIIWGAWVECGAAGVLVGKALPAGRGITPGAAAGAASATVICLQFHRNEFR